MVLYILYCTVLGTVPVVQYIVPLVLYPSCTRPVQPLDFGGESQIQKVTKTSCLAGFLAEPEKDAKINKNEVNQKDSQNMKTSRFKRQILSGSHPAQPIRLSYRQIILALIPALIPLLIPPPISHAKLT